MKNQLRTQNKAKIKKKKMNLSTDLTPSQKLTQSESHRHKCKTQNYKTPRR